MNIFFKKMSEGIANIDMDEKKVKYKRNSLKAYKMNVLNDIYFNW